MTCIVKGVSHLVLFKILEFTVVMPSECSFQEEMQKAAFQALQLQKDAVHNYIRNQVCVGV